MIQYKVRNITVKMYHFIGVISILICLQAKNTVIALERGPFLIWSQKSYIWSKFRGIEGEPEEWLSAKDTIKFTSSEVEERGYRYALTYDPVNNRLLWTDKADRKIKMQMLNDTFHHTKKDTIETLFSDTSYECNGLAIDWYTGNVYWTDATYKWIGLVSKTKGTPRYFRILISNDLDSPTGIVVHPKRGTMYWTDGGSGNNPRIEKATLNGLNRERIIDTDLIRPSGITLDTEENKLYWVDSGKSTVESYELDNGDRKTLVHSSGDEFSGISWGQPYLFVTSSKMLDLEVYDVNGAELHRHELDANPFDVTFIGPHTSYNVPRTECTNAECSHFCVNLGDLNGECMCRQGHYLELDKRTCSTSSPTYIYSIGTHLVKAKVDIPERNPNKITLQESVITDEMKEIRAIGYSKYEELIFFSDTQMDTIYSGAPSGDEWTELTVNARDVQGISVDWIANNIYWTDREEGHIMVSQLDGRYHRIFMQDIRSPTGIAVDAINRILYWCDAVDGGIWQIHLDGTGVKNILTDTGHPQGMTFDPRTRKLYWAEIERKRIAVLSIKDMFLNKDVMDESHSPNGYYDTTIFQGYLAWTDGEHGSLQFGHEDIQKKITDITVEKSTSLEALQRNNKTYKTYDVVNYDNYQQPYERGPCDNYNGECEQLCFPTPMGHACQCAIGYKLAPDKRSCATDIDQTDFLLFVDPYHKQLYQMNHENGKVNAVPVPPMGKPVTSDYDGSSKKIFWIDLESKKIMSSKLDGSDEIVIAGLPSGSIPKHMVLHKSEFLFFTDVGNKCIHRVNIKKSLVEEIFSYEINEPIGVAIDTEKEYIYWSEQGENPMIQSMNYKGEDRKTIQVVDDLMAPAGLVYTEDGHSLYWSDMGTGRIGVYNTSTEQSEILLHEPDKQIIAIAVHSHTLYFTAHNEKGVFKLDTKDKIKTKSNKLGTHIFARITDIKFITQKKWDPFPRVVPNPRDKGEDKYLIIGVAAGIVAFLLIILLCIGAFALGRHSRKRRRPRSQTNVAYVPDPEAGAAGPRDVNTNPGTSTDNGEVTIEVIPEFNDEYEGVYSTKLPSVSGTIASTASILTEPGELESDSEFELDHNLPVATVIRRAVTKLRNRLSSVRWNANEDRATIQMEPDVISTHSGKSGKSIRSKRGKKKPRTPTKKSWAQRKKRHGKKKITGADGVLVSPMASQLHRQPTGFAPASHAVPAGVIRQTWGRGKHPKINK